MNSLKELSNRIKKYADSKSLENSIMAWIRENPHIIMRYQMNQLFRDSVDREDNPLGFYGYNTVNYESKPKLNYRKQKQGGGPFTMIDTGSFFDGMTINVGTKYITITSTTPHLPSMLTNKFFDSVEFFGLTPQNERLFKSAISKFATEWITSGILTDHPKGESPSSV